MDMNYVEIARQFIGDYWPYVSGVVVPAVATAIFAHIRRPKSTARDTGPYFTEAELLTPPLTRPAYSDRMAYVLAEMSDLAYYQFEGEGGFIEDAVQAALERNLTDGKDIRQFLDQFSTDLMSGRRLSLDAFGNVLANSGFSLVDVINIRETQGFVCKRKVTGEPPYVVLAFRGTEKKISDWLTDVRCIPAVEGKIRVHTGFLDAFTKNVDAEGRTVEELVREILDRPEARDERGTPLPLFITGHSLGGALALLATRLIAPDVTGACARTAWCHPFSARPPPTSARCSISLPHLPWSRSSTNSTPWARNARTPRSMASSAGSSTPSCRCSTPTKDEV